MKQTGKLITLAGIVMGLFLLGSSLYKVNEMEQVIVTQFGRPVGDPRVTPGLKFKVPFIQKINRIEKRILEWDGIPTDMPTKDKLYISVDTFARWRIVDPLQYFLRLRDERSALSRLDDILGSETRNAVAKHELIEIVRSTKGREPLRDEALVISNDSRVGVLLPITKGRPAVEDEIYAAAAPKLEIFGLELLDVRFKRINYNQSVRVKIYDRMISERRQIAERFRSEGNGEAARILGRKKRDLDRIQSEAYREVETISGEADARATEIYATAYGQTPQSLELYTFLEIMETYRSVLDKHTTLILTTDSDLFGYLKGIAPEKE